ncbi:MAG: FKBP-type peptidyl-prolyl cis-trans isomerase [Bacteroidetes bacterium]|nr:FKBP-type peptidyl-prolyl cis-trans isomerase [Bacteroidota bacterium]
MRKIFLALLIVTAGCSLSFSQSDTMTTESGLKYIILEKGNGQKAESGKSVEVNYTGYLLDGKKFDSSLDRNEPLGFVLGTGKVIKGWDEGIALMNVGDKLRLIIPPELAYGKTGAGSVIPPDATLVFDVELMEVSEPKMPIGNVIFNTIMEKDITTAINQYRELKKTEPEKYSFKENELNILGYNLMQIDKLAEAVEIFKLNAEEYPASANVYDSLGEAYMVSGNYEMAIKNYKKSLELNPGNDNARKMLESMKSK